MSLQNVLATDHFLSTGWVTSSGQAAATNTLCVLEPFYDLCFCNRILLLQQFE